MDRPPAPLVSIIVPVRFRPDLFRVCLDTLALYTADYELIVVQDGIEPGVAEFATDPRITQFVQHPQAKGYPAAINTGFFQCQRDARFVVLLNSDTALTPGWFESILAVFEQPQVGLVAPVLSEDVERQRTPTPMTEVVMVKGACVVLRRAVAEAIAAANSGKLLNEAYGLGGGDDNELSAAVMALGFTVAVANRSFVYHYGSASFRQLFHHDVDFSKRYSANRFALFKSKHLADAPPAVRITVPCGDGLIHYGLAMRLLEWTHDPDIRVSLRFYPHLSPLDHARCRAVKDFLEGYDDYLLHIDADIVPPHNALRELLAANKDVVAPLCYTTHTDDNGQLFPMPVAHRYDANGQYRPYFPVTDPKGIHETDVVTGGCHLVKRAVFEQLERPYYFTYHKNGLVEYSEDFVFSRQCQALGLKLYTHYGLRCQHHRMTDVKAINDVLLEVSRGR